MRVETTTGSWIPPAARSIAKGIARRQVRERLPDARAALEQERPAVRRAGARTGAPSGSAPRARGSPGSGGARARRRRAPRRSPPRRRGPAPPRSSGTRTNCGGASSRAEQRSARNHREPGRVAARRPRARRAPPRSVARRGARAIAACATTRAVSSASESARWRSSPPSSTAREGLEAEVRRVRVRDRQQVLRVEVASAVQLRSDAARQEALLELRVVRDDHAALERGRDRLGQLVDARAPPRRRRRRARSGAAPLAAAGRAAAPGPRAW